MKTTPMVLLNTPACILIRSMFMRFKVNVWPTREKNFLMQAFCILCCAKFYF